MWRVWGCKKGRCFVAVTRDFQPKHPPQLIRSIIRKLPKSIICKIIKICLYETLIRQVTKTKLKSSGISNFDQTFFYVRKKNLIWTFLEHFRKNSFTIYKSNTFTVTDKTFLRRDLASYIKFKLFHSGHIFGYDRLLLASTMYFAYNHTKNIRSEIKIIFWQQ